MEADKARNSGLIVRALKSGALLAIDRAFVSSQMKATQTIHTLTNDKLQPGAQRHVRRLFLIAKPRDGFDPGVLNYVGRADSRTELLVQIRISDTMQQRILAQKCGFEIFSFNGGHVQHLPTAQDSSVWSDANVAQRFRLRFQSHPLLLEFVEF
jgi:hypothetical protein